MLAELAIANAAFAVIKETVANGGDIMAAGHQGQDSQMIYLNTFDAGHI